VAQTGAARISVRWASLARDRRAFRIAASPLEGGAVGVWTTDVTDAEAAAETLTRLAAAHEAVLNQVADALAIFSSERRLTFHNPSFADLWGLEPAWLAEAPTHAEILDRLRQRRRLPETGDFARFKLDELARYEQLEASSEAIWRLPGERTLRVVSQPHPQGGIVMLFSDITPELRLKTQFNQLIQVQQATLDKLTDAVAVFGADGRLKLHNEAFETFWNISAKQVAAAGDFDALVELCVRRFHDLQFWRELKARITDPDPSARAAVSQEIVTADQRIVAYQSRPLPDGATLISFADVTDTRKLEGALSDREAALAEAERLKREFVGSVSYELRTPLTTIIGYSELLERSSEGLTERGQGHVAAVKAAATQLARSINNVLDMAEIDAGEMALDVEDVDVAELLAEAAQRWAREAEAERVAIEVAMGDESGLIRGDARRLAQVLDHLAQNAIRNTPAGGRVTFAAERALGEIRLQVTDTGRGIPFHVQAHIFDRFGGPSRGGPGLGLALVKAIVELHGGWVALESEPNAGASFTCHLPEAAQVSAARPELF
jgi:signal transduction histidine kinase